jgi:hypothetical protein
MLFAAVREAGIGTFETCCDVRLKSGMRTKRTSTDHYARRHPAGLDLAQAGDEMAVRALTRFRPPRARGLVGEAAIRKPARELFWQLPIE